MVENDKATIMEWVYDVREKKHDLSSIIFKCFTGNTKRKTHFKYEYEKKCNYANFLRILKGKFPKICT